MRRWYRDPTLPVPRTEVTRFPHGVLEVKLSLPEGQQAPEWVQDLLDSGYLTEVRALKSFIPFSSPHAPVVGPSCMSGFRTSREICCLVLSTYAQPIWRQILSNGPLNIQ